MEIKQFCAMTTELQQICDVLRDEFGPILHINVVGLKNGSLMFVARLATEGDEWQLPMGRYTLCEDEDGEFKYYDDCTGDNPDQMSDVGVLENISTLTRKLISAQVRQVDAQKKQALAVVGGLEYALAQLLFCSKRLGLGSSVIVNTRKDRVHRVAEHVSEDAGQQVTLVSVTGVFADLVICNPAGRSKVRYFWDAPPREEFMGTLVYDAKEDVWHLTQYGPPGDLDEQEDFVT